MPNNDGLAEMLEGTRTELKKAVAKIAKLEVEKTDLANKVLIYAHRAETALRTPAETDWQCMYEAETRISAKQAAEIVQLRAQVEEGKTRVREACDLLAERSYGNPARSPGHNARLRLEGWSALTSTVGGAK